MSHVHRSLIVTTVALACMAASAHAQIRGAEANVGLMAFQFDEHERWPAAGGRVRFGRMDSPVEIGIAGTVALNPVFGGSWAHVDATVLHQPLILGERVYWGAGYSLIGVDRGAGSGSGHGGHIVAGVRLRSDRRNYWSAEGRLLFGPPRVRQDGSHEPIRTATFLMSRVWRR